MNLANKFSLSRLILTPVFVLAVLYCHQGNAFFGALPLIIFIIAIVTDAADGFIARRFNQVTRLGLALDPVADKILLITAFITLAFAKSIPFHLRIPPWVLIVVITRDAIILTGASIIYMIFKHIEFRPSVFGKITTFLQMATILSVLLRFEYSYIIWTVATIFTVLSGIHYLVRTKPLLAQELKRGA